MKTFNLINLPLSFIIALLLLYYCLEAFPLKAQTFTYTVNGPTRGQGSLLNTERTDVSGGWNMIHPSTAYGGASVNSWSSAQSIGFPFSFYGSPATHFCVSKNYLLTFDTTVAGTTVNSSITTDNTVLPHTDLPDSTIAYFWGGFSPPIGNIGNNDDVWRKTFGTAPNRQLWIKNHSYKHEAQGFSYNFVVLEETTHKIYVVDAQWENQGVGSYTVGVQLNSTTAIQHPNSPNISSINGSVSTPWPNVDYYEFTPRFLVNDDAGILSLDAPGSSTVPGSQSVQVSIKNHGINNLDSVKVNWSVDGVAQASLSWRGSLAPGAVVAAVNIGSYNFTLGNPTLKIWTSNPNGNADNNTSNDTLEVSLLVCISLSGAYTLGGTSSDFPNFNSLATFLRNCGISGSVIIKVAPGTYREQFFILGNINGVSQSNTIIIDGGDTSLVTLTHSGIATVVFYSTSYVSLRNMTLENTKSSTDAWVVHLQNTDHIVIDSCLIEQPVNTTSDRGGIVGSGSLTSAFTITTNKHLTVSDNIIRGGYHGIALQGSTSDEDVGNHVLRNRFSDIEKRAIQVLEQDSLIISGNVIENINNSNSQGIQCYDITDFEITANNLLDCGDRGIAIYKAGSSGTARSLIANNMIYAPKDAGIRMRGLSSGLSNSKVNVYHNTIVGDPAMEFTSGGNSNMSIYNNIFSNPNGAALETSSSLPSTIKIDYNLYQASGNIAEDGSTSHANLAAWQAAKPALNRNSVEGNPLFVKATSPADLHLIGTLANDIGDNSVGIKVDIDGDSRPLPPSTRVDMGADEYHLPTCLPSSRLSASVRSGSAASLSWTAGGALNWNIEYGPPGFIPGSGTFVYNVLNPYILTGLNPNTNYDFYVQDSCGMGDVSLWTGPFTFQTACVNALSGTYTLGRASSDFPDFDSLATFLNNCGILGPVIIKVASGTYKESFTLGSITGVSQSNTIVIDGGSSSLARLIHDGSTSNATVAFDSTSYVSLRNVTLENIKSSTAAWVVHLQNTDHIVIDSCLIEMSVNTTVERVGIVGSGSLSNGYTATTNNHLTISNNTITGGYYGISLSGNTSNKDVGNRILRNRFSDIELIAIGVYEQDNLIISGNVIENTNSSYAYDIYCVDITDFEIRANNLLDCGDQGIVIEGGTSSGTARSLIANNMIYAPDAAISMSGFGFSFLSNLSKVNIYHNTAVGRPAMRFIGGSLSNMSIYNNIFSNPNGVALEALQNLPSTIDIDYNLYQASGNIAAEGFTIYANLTAWQAAKPTLNRNSVEGNPLFVRAISPADLHLIGTLANDTGDNSVGIKVDIDGDSRPLPPSTRVDMGADEYHLPTCLPSSRLSASARSGSAASLSWTASGALNWNIEYGPPGFIPGSGTFVYNVLNPYILTGLNPSTNYDFYVQDSCGVGDVSVWSGSFSFITLCSLSSSPATLPLMEDFESLSGTFQRDTVVFCVPTYNWSYETSLANNGRLRFAVSGFANNGSSAATLDKSILGVPSQTKVTNYLIMTADLSNYSSSSILELEFSYMHHREYLDPNDKVWIRGRNTDAWIQIYDLYANQGGAGIYKQVTSLDIDAILANATLPQRVSSTFQVRFGQEGYYEAQNTTTNAGYSFDDIAIREVWCRRSSSLTVNTIGLDTASVSWTGGGGGNVWIIEWGTAGFTQGSGTLDTITTNSYTLKGLTPFTTYDFYVRDSCSRSGNSLSLWSFPISFKTLCPSLSPATLPLIEDFESLSGTFQRDAPVLCAPTYNWSYETSHAKQGRLRFAVSSFANNGSSAATLDKSISTSSLVTNYLIMTADLSNYNSSSALELEFSYMHHGEENHANDRVWIQGSNTDAWVQIYNLYTNQGGAGIYNQVIGLDIDVILANATPPQRVSSTFQVRFGQQDDFPAAFRTTSDGYSFDDIAIRETCPGPTKLTATQITQTSATLSWVAGGASNWDLEYGLSGFTLGSGTQIHTTIPSYTVSGLTLGMGYDFYVRDSCGIGHVSSWAGPDTFTTLSATLPCPSPSSLSATQITQTSVRLSWVTGGASNWDVEYGLSGFTLGSGTGISTTTPSYTVSGLTPGQSYQFYVRDSCGVAHVSSWAGPHTFTTLSATLPCPVPSSLLASNITQTTAALSWVTGGASNWNMEYGIQGFTPGSGTFVYNVPNPYTLTGLTPGTTYDFYVRDSCGSNNLSTWAGPYTFRTLSCPSPTGLTLDSIAQTTAKLSWITGGASNWDVEYGIQGFIPGSGTFMSNVSSPYTLSGLTPGTDYDFYVRDSCGVGHVSSWAGPDAFTTLSATLPCPSPSSLGASNITQTSARLSWMSGGTSTSNWDVEYGLSGFTLGSGTRISTTTPFYTVSGLTPGTDYDFYVRDSCGAAHVSSWAGPGTFTTLSATLPCPSPSSLGASNITQTSARLSWMSGGISISNNWDLEYGLSGFTLGSGTRISTTISFYTVSGLTPGQSYQFYVRDSCGVGHVSSWAGPDAFTTLSATLPCPSPSSLSATQITQNSARLLWMSGGTSTSNWDLEYGLSGFTLGQGTQISTTTPSYTVSGLTSGTDYDFYVRDSCGVGHVSSWAGPYTFITLSVTLPCPSPSSLSATQITQTSARLSWVTGGASTWGLEYGLSGFTLGSGTRISTTTPSYTVSGLTPGRSHQFYVRDSCGVGHVSSWAGPHTFRNLGCLAPTGLNLHTITEITATVSWTSGGASNWNIEYGPINFPLGGGIFLYNVSSPRTLRGLKPNTFYDVYVQDSCNVGNVSNWTGPLSIKTIIGIDELLERSLRIYPNPSEGVFKLEFSSSLGEDMEIRIINMLGQIVLEDEIESFSGSYRKKLEMGAYRSGVYLLQLITERATVNRRIILQ